MPPAPGGDDEGAPYLPTCHSSLWGRCQDAMHGRWQAPAPPHIGPRPHISLIVSTLTPWVPCNLLAPPLMCSPRTCPPGARRRGRCQRLAAAAQPRPARQGRRRPPDHQPRAVVPPAAPAVPVWLLRPVLGRAPQRCRVGVASAAGRRGSHKGARGQLRRAAALKRRHRVAGACVWWPGLRGVGWGSGWFWRDRPTFWWRWAAVSAVRVDGVIVGRYYTCRGLCGGQAGLSSRYRA